MRPIGWQGHVPRVHAKPVRIQRDGIAKGRSNTENARASKVIFLFFDGLPLGQTHIRGYVSCYSPQEGEGVRQYASTLAKFAARALNMMCELRRTELLMKNFVVLK